MYRKISLMIIFLIAFCCITSIFSVYATTSAEIILEATKNEIYQSEKASVELKIKCDESNSVGAFYGEIEYDNSKLEFSKILSSGSVQNSELTCQDTKGSIKLLYCDNDAGDTPISRVDPGVCKIEFIIKENVLAGDISINLSSFTLLNVDSSEITTLTYSNEKITVLEPLSTDALLSDIKIDSLTLTPKFSSNTFVYNVSAPYSLSSLDITATPRNYNATVKISRKTLQKAGETTEITITVTAEDKKTKQEYLLKVYRNLATSSSGSVSSKSASSKSASSKSTSSKSTSSKSSSSKETSSKNSIATSEGVFDDDAINIIDLESEILSSTLSKSNLNLVTKDTVKVKENNYSVFLMGLAIGVLILIAALLLVRKNDNEKD